MTKKSRAIMRNEPSEIERLRADMVEMQHSYDEEIKKLKARIATLEEIHEAFYN